MGLDGADHKVLRAQLGRVAGGAQAHGEVGVGADEAQPAGLDGREVRAARDDGHVGAALRQPCREMAADGAGTEDGDLHGAAPPRAAKGVG